MPGGATTNQQQSQAEAGTQAQSGTMAQNGSTSSSTGPWGATSGLLGNIITQLGGQTGAPTADQTAAAGTLSAEAGGVPSFAPQASGLASNLFDSTATNAPMMTDAYGNLSKSLSPYLSSSYLDPMSNPYLGDAMKTMNSDITNQVNDQFAAAGRDLSPANTTALARGLSQGEGGLLAGQFNTNVGTQTGAANTLYGAGNATAEGLTGLQQTALGNQEQGIGVASAVPGLATLPGQTQLSAANTSAQLPFQNLGWLEGLVNPVAGLGTQTQGTTANTGSTAGTGTYAGTGNMTGSTTQQTSPTSNIIGGGLGALSLLSMFSDERVKEDITPIGMLYDETPVYSFNYIGDPVPRVGLMAQDVEKSTPEAVSEVGGVKVVHYGMATERARKIRGMLDDLDLAA